MAGFDMGWQSGMGAADRNAARRDLLTDEERQGRSAQLMKSIAAGRTKLATLAPGSPEHTKLSDELMQAESAWNNLYHPARNHNPSKAFEELHDLFQRKVLHRTGHTDPARVSESVSPGSTAGTQPGMGATDVSSPGANIAINVGGKTVDGSLPAQSAALPTQPMQTSATAGMQEPVVAQAPPRNAAEARQRADSFLAQFGIDTTADPLTEKGREGEFNREQQGKDFDWQVEWAKKHGVSDEAIEELKEHQLGIPVAKVPRPLAGDAGKPFESPVGSGVYYQKAQDPTTGAYIDIPMGAGWTPPAARPSSSKYAQDKLTYAQSLGKRPEQLTWKELGDFERKEWTNNNPYGPARFQLQREGLDYRESQGDLRSYMGILKAQQPLDRIIQTADEAQKDVQQPTGPGDVALTLAFFDAIKTQGVRFTKQEQDFITNSRGFMDGVQAKFDGGFSGTVYGPAGSPQRALIAGIVQKAADAAKTQKGALTQGAGAFRPAVAKALGANGASSPAAKTYKYTATGPNGHKIGTNDDPKSPAAVWYDTQTGKQVQ